MPTKIEWTDETWNPITGCTPISEGCENCYCIRMFGRNLWDYDSTPGTFHESRLYKPIDWEKPIRIFVCSMSDLFHEAVNIRGVEIRSIFRVMSMCDHTFMLLTKRPERMADCIDNLYGKDFAEEMPNVWLGVTAENQMRADERIPILMQIPAKVRFVSVEPMLRPVNARNYLPAIVGHERFHHDHSDLDWVIAGPETGPGKRECKPEWIDSLHRQCQDAGVPFFDKSKRDWRAREFPEEA